MRVLVVDDDKSIRRTLEKFLQSEGYEVTTAADGTAALEAFGEADAVLLDLGLPGKDGFDVLTEIQKNPGAPPVVVITARDDMQSTVRAVQLGAFEYLVKPIDIDLVKHVVSRALEARETARQAAAMTAERAVEAQDGVILGKSPAMREVYKQIGAVSRSRATVLVRGESGTGKELVAKAIHAASCPSEPFVGVNFTSLASGVLESELFGHVRGAYTGASADRVGRFEAAGAGTLFLDEIAEIPLELQAKLLRVLQEKTFERVGDTRPMPLRARVIAATHRDLAAMVKSGAFREDLFYRLQVVEIGLPALRERPDDIPLLVMGLVAKINRDVSRAVRIVTPEAMDTLRRHPWPGNVRELENTLTRAIVLAKGDAIDRDVLAGLAPTSGAAALPAEGDLLPLREVERRHIDHVLRQTEWNKRRACAVLEISRPTLDRKIEEYGLKKP